MKVLGIILLVVVLGNPFIATPLVIWLAGWIFLRPDMRPYRRWLAIATAMVLAIYFALDTAFARQRMLYAQQIPKKPTVHHTIQPPSSIVLVGLDCDKDCLDKLVDGTFNYVIVVGGRSYRWRLPQRYSVKRGRPEDCQIDPALHIEALWGDASIKKLRESGICPIVENSVMPSEGIFVVHEGVFARSRERDVKFIPQYIVARPPGAVIEFQALEVQRRSSAGTEVLAESLYYVARGYAGLPPLVGCWERPDNIFWTMPTGDTGCGFWHRMLWGGDSKSASKADWVYASVFASPR